MYACERRTMHIDLASRALLRRGTLAGTDRGRSQAGKNRQNTARQLQKNHGAARRGAERAARRGRAAGLARAPRRGSWSRSARGPPGRGRRETVQLAQTDNLLITLTTQLSVSVCRPLCSLCTVNEAETKRRGKIEKCTKPSCVHRALHTPHVGGRGNNATYNPVVRDVYAKLDAMLL